jgi:hypothetical protein
MMLNNARKFGLQHRRRGVPRLPPTVVKVIPSLTVVTVPIVPPVPPRLRNSSRIPLLPSKEDNQSRR